MNSPQLQPRLDYFTPAVGLRRMGETQITSYQLAGAGARSLAGLVDFAIQIILFAVVARLIGTRQPDLAPPSTWPWAIPLAFAECHILYIMLAESILRGRTPGRVLLGLRVITTGGQALNPAGAILRALGRVLDLLLGCYAVSFVMINTGARRQSLTDRLGRNYMIYSRPLREQLASADVPESFYSTSEAGYLLEAWMQRNPRMDKESQAASALDLSAYLHRVYEPDARDLPDPPTYLKILLEREMAEAPNPTLSPATKSE